MVTPRSARDLIPFSSADGRCRQQDGPFARESEASPEPFPDPFWARFRPRAGIYRGPSVRAPWLEARPDRQVAAAAGPVSPACPPQPVLGLPCAVDQQLNR